MILLDYFRGIFSIFFSKSVESVLAHLWKGKKTNALIKSNVWTLMTVPGGAVSKIWSCIDSFSMSFFINHLRSTAVKRWFNQAAHTKTPAGSHQYISIMKLQTRPLNLPFHSDTTGGKLPHKREKTHILGLLVVNFLRIGVLYKQKNEEYWSNKISCDGLGDSWWKLCLRSSSSLCFWSFCTADSGHVVSEVKSTSHTKRWCDKQRWAWTLPREGKVSDMWSRSCSCAGPLAGCSSLNLYDLLMLNIIFYCL